MQSPSLTLADINAAINILDNHVKDFRQEQERHLIRILQLMNYDAEAELVKAKGLPKEIHVALNLVHTKLDIALSNITTVRSSSLLPPDTILFCWVKPIPYVSLRPRLDFE